MQSVEFEKFKDAYGVLLEVFGRTILRERKKIPQGC